MFKKNNFEGDEIIKKAGGFLKSTFDSLVEVANEEKVDEKVKEIVDETTKTFTDPVEKVKEQIIGRSERFTDSFEKINLQEQISFLKKKFTNKTPVTKIFLDSGLSIQINAIGHVKGNFSIKIDDDVLSVKGTPQLDNTWQEEIDFKYDFKKENVIGVYDTISTKLENGILIISMDTETPEPKTEPININID